MEQAKNPAPGVTGDSVADSPNRFMPAKVLPLPRSIYDFGA